MENGARSLGLEESIEKENEDKEKGREGREERREGEEMQWE